jgi:hypothetical protein
MLKAVKKIAESIIGASDPREELRIRIAEARATVDSARAALDRVRAERAHAVRSAKVAFDDASTEDAADAMLHAEGKQRLFVGRAEQVLQTAETLLASLERQHDEAELQALERSLDGIAVGHLAEEIVAKHGQSLIEAAIAISREIEALQTKFREDGRRLTQLREKLGGRAETDARLRMLPLELDNLMHVRGGALLRMINQIEGGRSALWLREI